MYGIFLARLDGSVNCVGLGGWDRNSYRAFVSNHGKDHAQYDATGGGQIRINDQIMSTIAGDLVTTASTATSIHYAGQSQLIADGKLDVAETGQTGDYHLEERTRYRIQDTESIQSLWANDAWTETNHPFTVDQEAHNAWVYNQTVNLPKNSDPIITNNPDGSTSIQIINLGQDQSTVTSTGGYDYRLTQSGSPTDFVFSLGHTSQSQSGKHDTGTWRAADGSSGATYDNLGSETKNSRANLSGQVQNGSVYYTGIDVSQTKNTGTNNTGSGFALGSTTSSHTVGSTQTIETRGGNSGSWYGSKLEIGNSTTNYTTVSGTMGQPFSDMNQTGFNMTTPYGTAAQPGITGSYGSNQNGQTALSGPAQLPNIPAPNVGNCSPEAQAKLNTIYNAYRQSAANQSYYASQYANRPGANFVAPSLDNQLQLIKDAVLNGSLKPDVNQFKRDLLDGSANFSAGWADSLTLGYSNDFRNWAGINNGIDHGSPTYQTGQLVGAVHSVALGGLGTPSLAIGIRVPNFRNGLVLDGGGALRFAPAIERTITIVGAQQARIIISGGFGILHVMRMGQNGEKREPAPERMVLKYAAQIEKDLGKEARKKFHNKKLLGMGDRTKEELKIDIRELYEEYGK